MEGAIASTYFQRNADREPSFTVPEPIEAATSNARGLLALKLEIPGHLDGAGSTRSDTREGRPLVGLRKVTREELDKPITITMHPACRVLLPDREHRFTRPGDEISRRTHRSRLVASGLRDCWAPVSTAPRARCSPAQQMASSSSCCRPDG